MLALLHSSVSLVTVLSVPLISWREINFSKYFSIKIFSQILTAMSPGKVRETEEGWYEIEECPGYDDAVVDVEPEHDGHGGVAHSLNTKHQRFQSKE